MWDITNRESNRTVKIVIENSTNRYTTGRPSIVCVNLGLKKVVFIGISNVPNVFYQRK